MRVNVPMREVLKTLHAIPLGALPAELKKIIRRGWYLTEDGALVLESLEPRSLLSRLRVSRRYRRGEGRPSCWDGIAEYEYHTNDVRIPDGGLPLDRDQFIPAMAARSFGFVEAAFRSAARFTESDTLTAVISIGVGDEYLTHGAVVKFFTQRAGCPDWYDDLDRFKLEAIAVLMRVDI
ncbi:hypothetical protein ACWGPQ_19470 [Saccharomonospora azurea]